MKLPATSLLVVVVAAVLLVAMPVSAGATGGTEPLQTLSDQKMSAEVQKLKAEAAKIRDERSTFADVVRLAPFITALVALAGLIVALLKQQAEATRQRTLDRDEHEKARLQRFDEQFQQTAANLSSEKSESRAAAVASMVTFMRPEYKEFHERVFLLLLGVLRFPRNDFSDKLLVRALQRVAAGQIPAADEGRSGPPLDLSNCNLARVKLQGLNLSESDLGFTDLHGADLSGSSLWRVNGYGVILCHAHLERCDLEEARLNKAKLAHARLVDANLVSAKLKECDANETIFAGARLQEAHFEGATFTKAHFEGANLNNAYFYGARLDTATLRNIALRAQHWREANWDKEVEQTLTAISERGAQ